MRIFLLLTLISSANIQATTIKHVVQKGESLLSIASRYYGDPNKWKCLLKTNPIYLERPELKSGGIIIINLNENCLVKEIAKKAISSKKSKPVAKKKAIKKSIQRNLKSLSMIGKYTIQIASFPEKSLAMKKKNELEDLYQYEFDLKSAKVKNKTWFRLRIGGFEDKKSAIKFANQIGLKDDFIVMPL